MSDVLVPIHYRVRVKQRLRVLAYADEHGLKPAARHFTLGRTTCGNRAIAGMPTAWRGCCRAIRSVGDEARLEHRFRC